MRLLLSTLLFVSVAQAELIRVKVLNASGVGDAYLAKVIEATKERYRNDLRIRLRVRTAHSDLVAHDYDLEDRFAEFDAWGRKLKLRKVWNRVQFVGTEPYFDSHGCSYGAGLASWFGMGVIRGYESCSGADRFASDWVTMAHELCHVIAYNRRRFGFASQCDHDDRTHNLMHSNAMAYAGEGLRFRDSTRADLKL